VNCAKTAEHIDMFLGTGAALVQCQIMLKDLRPQNDVNETCELQRNKSAASKSVSSSADRAFVKKHYA